MLPSLFPAIVTAVRFSLSPQFQTIGISGSLLDDTALHHPSRLAKLPPEYHTLLAPTNSWSPVQVDYKNWQSNNPVSLSFNSKKASNRLRLSQMDRTKTLVSAVGISPRASGTQVLPATFWGSSLVATTITEPFSTISS
jgi:hypothetical protein